MAFGALIAVAVGSLQGVFMDAPSPSTSSLKLAKTQSIETEQIHAADAGRALGLGKGEKLVVKDVMADRDGWTHVRYDRTYQGLRVIGGDLVSHLDPSGRIRSVSWNARGAIAIGSTTPKISLASAVERGAERASFEQGSTLASDGDLVVYAGGRSTKGQQRLAYDVRSDGLDDQTPSRFHVIVDAGNGGVLASWDEIKRGTGNGLHVGTVPIITRADPRWSMRDEVGNYTTGLSGAVDEDGTVPGTTFTDSDNVWGNGSATDPVSAAVDAQYGARKTFDFYKDVLGRNGITVAGVGVRSRVHYGTNYANSYWDGAQATYGDGAGNAHPFVELDIVGHELTHGVTESTAGLISTGEAGGLSEATSDIFGTSIEWYANNVVDRPDYLIGELLDARGNGTPLRYLDRPSRDGVSPDCWSGRVGSLATSSSSGPLNHWFYLASEGSGAKVINGVSYNSPTCNDSKVTPVGRDKAAKIWYRTLSTYLTSSSTYAAAREGAIQATKDLYGSGSPECVKIAAAFSAIAVPPGAQRCGVPIRSTVGIYREEPSGPVTPAAPRAE